MSPLRKYLNRPRHPHRTTPAQNVGDALGIIAMLAAVVIVLNLV